MCIRDSYFNVYDRHPDTGVEFVGYQLPMVPEAIALAKEAAHEIPQAVSYTHLDVYKRQQGAYRIEKMNRR